MVDHAPALEQSDALLELVGLEAEEGAMVLLVEVELVVERVHVW